MRHALALGLLLGALGCGRGSARTPDQPGDAAGITPAQLAFLKFAPVERIAPAEVADLAGTIEFDEQRTARLGTLVPGRVAELLVEVGDHVAADQPLLAIESPDVKVAQADYVREEADLVVARRGAERADRLRAAGAIAEKDYLQAKEDARKAEAEFERARATLERLQIAPGDPTSRYLLRAPFAGSVVERKALVGMEVGPETAEPLLTLSDLSRLRVVVRLPERELPLVRLGQAIGVRVDAYPKEFAGTVAAIGDVVDDATRTVPVRSTLANAEHLLKPAMFARVSLKAPPGLALTAVPTSAVLSDGRRFRVVVRGPEGKLEVRPIDVGAELAGYVEVLGGIDVGEQVVTEGALLAEHALSDAS